MVEVNNSQNPSEEIEHFPVEPRYHPANRLTRSVYDFLASARLAMTLLVAILICCLCGGVFFNSEQAQRLIYGSLWFNALLIFLVTNTACCFFGRIWGRRVSIISFGMILFHLSFVIMFLAIVYNSLFYFDGLLRLTEGETVANGDRQVYDNPRHGLFFKYSRLKGSISLLKFHRGFKVDNDEKNFAYDLAFDGTNGRTRDQVYINHKVVNDGFEYFRDREGYSLLFILEKANGGELYGAHFPLQSLRIKDALYMFTTGTSEKADRINFPPDNIGALFGLQAEYKVNPTKDRDGTIHFQIWPKMVPLSAESTLHNSKPPLDGSVPHSMTSQKDGNVHISPASGGHVAPVGSVRDVNRQERLADGTVAISEKFAFGEYLLHVREVRYWVGMNVRYNPGKPVVLTSLWVGLSGLIITMFGRLRRSKI